MNIVRATGRYHPILKDLAPAIARDKGLAVDTIVGSKQEMNRLVDEFVRSGLGQRIETRRWWTKYDGDRFLDSIWHLLLAGLILQFYMGGVDPWSLALDKAAINPEEKDEVKKEFNFKVEVLLTLMDDFKQNCMRSGIIIFKRMRAHHAAFITRHSVAGASMKFHIFWSTLKDSPS